MRALPMAAGFVCTKRHAEMAKRPRLQHKFIAGQCVVCLQHAADCIVPDDKADELGIFDSCPGTWPVR